MPPLFVFLACKGFQIEVDSCVGYVKIVRISMVQKISRTPKSRMKRKERRFGHTSSTSPSFFALVVFIAWIGENGCSGSQTHQNPQWDTRRFQTPPPHSPEWKETFQSYRSVEAHASIAYDSPDRSSATSSNTFHANKSSVTKPISVEVHGSDGSRIVLENIDFAWNAPPIIQPSNYKSGQKGAIIEMFGWPYADIEQECEALGKMGYLGVKVYPQSEHIVSWRWLQNGELNPWYWNYQPVSYRLTSRMGTRDELRSMIQTCRRFGVRVYADAVVNHMTGGGNDVGPHRNGNGGGCVYWGPKESSDGSPYFTQDFNYALNNYTQEHPALEYPAVPYGPLDFHCERPLNSWSDPFDLNFGWLEGLSDLATETSYVRNRIADYFSDLISIGFSGFRIDAAKHICPDDLAAIFSLFKERMGGQFPDDFISYLEVLIGGEKDLLMCQYSNYQYSQYFDDAMQKAGLSVEDISKIKIWESDYPKEFPICGSWIIPSSRFAAENDCHDDQFPGSSSRDMGDKGSVLVKERDVPKHRGFEKELFLRTDGDWQIKLVLSSYTFMDYGAYGFPDGISDCKHCVGPDCANCKSMPYSKAHDPNVCGYTVYDGQGNWSQGVYTRVHRDKSIILAMRQWMGLPTDIPNSELGLPAQCTAL